MVHRALSITWIKVLVRRVHSRPAGVLSASGRTFRKPNAFPAEPGDGRTYVKCDLFWFGPLHFVLQTN